MDNTVLFIDERMEKNTHTWRTYFFTLFSVVSKTNVDASFRYVPVDVPLAPDISLRLDRAEPARGGANKSETRYQRRFNMRKKIITEISQLI